MKPRKTIPKNIYLKIFSEKIRYVREGMNMTQAQFAEFLGCSQQTINVWESSKSIPSIPTLADIAKRFNVSIDWLFGKEIPTEIIFQVPQEYSNIISEYDKLNKAGKEKVAVYIRDLLGNSENTEKEKTISA